MRPVYLLLKPVSGDCGMRCRYCFYRDETARRQTPSYGRMSADTVDAILKKAFAVADECCFMFQGGEPLLAGPDFFRHFVAAVERENIKKVPVSYTVQTGGVPIDDGWAAFFKEHHFLVGLSMDGIAETHDRWRVDANGVGTFDRVSAAADILTAHGVDFNIVTVVTAQVAKRTAAVYAAYKARGFRFQQYIPCLDPLDGDRGNVYALTPSLYAKHLKARFDLWYSDRRAGNAVFDRTFDNYLGILRGFPPESCGMGGGCSRQLVVEADGSVFPCDFYALDKYWLGNLTADSFDDLERRREETGFLRESAVLPSKCRRCEWFLLCRGGCRRDREPFSDGLHSENYFCAAFREFFAYAAPRLKELARKV